MVACVISGLVAGQIVSAQTAPDTPVPSDTRTPPNTAADKTAPMGANTPPAAPAKTPAEVYKDIEATVGFVPQFFRQIADSQIESFWASMKTFQMNPNTALDGKTKELIGLAVAAQIPCDYCVAFHTQAARKNGATDQELREAVGMAAMTRLGSTVLNGNQTDQVQFKKDLQRMMKDTGTVKRQATR
jgi:AhpD family alkylhydroperoxidase